jgi:hypothetical protein
LEIIFQGPYSGIPPLPLHEETIDCYEYITNKFPTGEHYFLRRVKLEAASFVPQCISKTQPALGTTKLFLAEPIGHLPSAFFTSDLELQDMWWEAPASHHHD